MKKTKFVFATLLGLSVAFLACEKSSNAPADTTIASLSTADSALMDFSSLATADSSSHTHKKENITEVAVSALPASISSYITTNYSGSTIERAGTTDTGYYIVGVLKSDNTHVALVFDATGKFVEAKKPKLAKPTPVAVSALPAAITSYISKTYANSKIKRADLMGSGDYVVLIAKADSTHALLGFTSDGTFKAEITMLPKGLGGSNGSKPPVNDSVAIAALPASITTYINTNYPKAVIVDAHKGPDGNYGLIIQKADASYALMGFKSDGTFIGILQMPPKH